MKEETIVVGLPEIEQWLRSGAYILQDHHAQYTGVRKPGMGLSIPCLGFLSVRGPCWNGCYKEMARLIRITPIAYTWVCSQIKALS